MAEDYLVILHRRNLLTMVYALLAAALINTGLFIIMPMLQSREPVTEAHLRIVPDVGIVHLKPRRQEHRKYEKDRQEIRRVADALRPPEPRVSDIMPRVPELPFRIDPGFQPALKGLAAIPVESGLNIDMKAGGVFSAGELDAPVGIEVRVPPVYPLRARERRVEGWVRVKLLVDRNGHVEQADIVEAQPAGYFEKSVLDCVRRWKLTPPTVGGEAVKAWMVTKIRFRLE